jgi:hypothetical protein
MLVEHPELVGTASPPRGEFRIDAVFHRGRIFGGSRHGDRSVVGSALLQQRVLVEAVEFYAGAFEGRTLQKLIGAQRFLGGPPEPELVGYQHLHTVRKLSLRTIRRFGVGFGSRDLREHLQQHFRQVEAPALDEVLLDVKLCRREDDKWIEEHKGRIVFPVRGANGEIQGMVSRACKTDPGPGTLKYKSPGLKAGGAFFGLKEWLEPEEPDLFEDRSTLFLAEGPIDLLTLYEGGARSALATLGAVFTESHARLVRETLVPAGVRTIVVCYDADPAGDRGADGVVTYLHGGEVSIRRSRWRGDLKDVSEVWTEGAYTGKLGEYLAACSEELRPDRIDAATRFSPEAIAKRFHSKLVRQPGSVKVSRRSLVAFVENHHPSVNELVQFLEGQPTPESEEDSLPLPSGAIEAIRGDVVCGEAGVEKQGGEAVLFFYIAAKWHRGVGVANFRNATLCEALGITERTLQRYKQRLEKMGLLLVKRDGRKRHLCRYIPIMTRWVLASRSKAAEGGAQ